MTIAKDRIKEIARECAVKGLRLREARALFDALHTADAIYAVGGSVTKAAALQGQTTPSLSRRSRRRSAHEGACARHWPTQHQGDPDDEN